MLAAVASKTRNYREEMMAITISDTNGSTVTDSTPVVLQISGKPVADTVIGAGFDSVVLRMSEDAYQGDAQFTISVNGQQQGGIQIAQTAHGFGQSQQFIVYGEFGSAPPSVSVNFLNDAWGGSAATDRNLFVDAATYNGAALTPTSAALFNNGVATFTQSGIAPDITVGTGADSFLFKISEDAYAGDAQFTVSIDGKQQGGIITASALHSSGQSQNVEVKGDFGSSSGHAAVVTFLNDAYDGSPATDRNLYVDAVSFNGTSLTPSSGAFFNQGSMSFIQSPTTLDTLSVALSEDAWQGDAQAEISIDGSVLGKVTVTALNSGDAQQFSFTGNFGTGAHTVGVNFLNDAYGGTADTDRNLFVKGVTFNGTFHPDATANLVSNGLVTFNV